MAKVLLVDDDTDVRESLCDWLEHEHQVKLACGVPEALVLLGQERPDVVVADFELGPYFGDDFLAMVAELYPSVGRILHTGSPCRRLGYAYSIAHCVLKKGSDPEDLSTAIREIVNARRDGDAR